MRLLWLDINASYSHSSLALPSLHAQLSERQLENVEWKVVSGTINSDCSFYFLEIEEFNPDIVMSTAWLFNHDYILNLLSKYAKVHPKTKIILGGPEFLGDNREYLIHNNFITAVFRGEGEEVFPQIMDSLIADSNWKSITGMCWIDATGTYKDNGISLVLEFCNLIPPEKSDFFNWDKPFVQIETSRGCFNDCSFCISGGSKVQNIPLEEIQKRLETIRIKGIKEVRVLDRTFNANPKRAAKLLSIFEMFAGDIKFHLEIHPAYINNEIKNKLMFISDGLLHLEAGVQSLDESVLLACKRKGSGEKSIEGIKYLLSVNKFELHADIIVGLPLYTYKRTLEDIGTLIKIGADEIQIEKLKLLPGTQMRIESYKYKIAYSSNPPYEVLSTNSVSPTELYKLSIVSKSIDIWYNNKVWRDTFRNIFLMNNRFFEMFLEYIISNKIIISNIGLESKGIILFDFCVTNQKESVSDVIYAWINAGLSLKKGPGKLAQQWIRGISVEINPLFIEESHIYQYYFHKDIFREYWYAFDRRDKKAKPSKSLICNLGNTNNFNL